MVRRSYLAIEQRALDVAAVRTRVQLGRDTQVVGTARSSHLVRVRVRVRVGVGFWGGGGGGMKVGVGVG